MIKLIINADDFGLSKIFNSKILDLLEKGYARSTTVLVNRLDDNQKEQIEELIRLKDAKKISVGLHLDISREKPAPAQIEEEYNRFVKIFGSAPSHLDIHKYDKLGLTIIKKVDAFADAMNLPVRNHGTKMSAKHTTYPAFHCSNWILELDEIKEFLSKMKDGTSCEIITHPGSYDPDSKSSLNEEREKDYQVIVDLQKFLKSNRRIKNISYNEL
jgi:predicted glycoside hydrolase/deacetylase ChbG (UPF0249 family)